jgi:hypothetical protein
MVLRIIRNCLEENKSCDCGVEVLELCQALIRNQDYEIFQPGKIKFIASLNIFGCNFIFIRIKNRFISD